MVYLYSQLCLIDDPIEVRAAVINVSRSATGHKWNYVIVFFVMLAFLITSD